MSKDAANVHLKNSVQMSDFKNLDKYEGMSRCIICKTVLPFVRNCLTNIWKLVFLKCMACMSTFYVFRMFSFLSLFAKMDVPLSLDCRLLCQRCWQYSCSSASGFSIDLICLFSHQYDTIFVTTYLDLTFSLNRVCQCCIDGLGFFISLCKFRVTFDFHKITG